MKTRRFDFNFRPLQINIGFAVDGSVPSTQNYDADTATYTPDYTLTPLIIQPQVSCMDKDEVLQAGRINHQLANIKWYEITGGVSTLIQSTDTHYEITASGSNAGRIKVKKNAAPRTPITLEFHAEFCDPRTGQIHSIIRTFLIKCTNATMSPPQLLLDAADQTLYNPLTDADEQTVHASLRVGMQECPVANRAFVWDVYRPDTEAWTKVGADTTLDYDVEVAADGASCKVNRALMGHELHLRCRAKYDANGVSAKTVAINASARAFTLYSDGVKTYAYPQRIALNAALQGTSECQWSYKRPGQSDFTDIPGATGAAYSLAPDAAIWGSNVNQAITLRCTSGDVHDEVTICKALNSDSCSPNLILKGNAEKRKNNTTEFALGNYTPDNLSWAQGDELTVSACICVGDNDEGISIEIGTNHSSALFTPSAKNTDEVVTIQCTLSDIKDASKVAVYKNPWSDGLFAPNTYVKWLVIQRGHTSGVTQWIPAASEMVSIDGAAGAVSPNLLIGTKNWNGWKVNLYDGDGEYNGLIARHSVIDSVSPNEYKDLRADATVDLENDTIYTMSVWAKGTGRFRTFCYPDVNAQILIIDGAASDSTGADTAASHQLTSEWKCYYVVFRTVATGDLKNKHFVAARIERNLPSEVWIAGAKLEKGRNDNPQWSPAALEEDTIALTNERHIFAGDAEKAVASSTESEVVAYKGATRMPATIGTITGAPTGMTVSVQDNSTTSAKFTVAVTSALTAKQGELTVPVTVDGKSFTKKFSWAVSLADITLTDAAPCKVVSFIRRIPKFEYDITGVPVNIPADILAIAPEASIWDANGAINDPERELLPIWYIATNKASGTLSYTQVAHGMTPIISTSAMSDNYGAVLGLDVVDAGPLSAMEDSDGAVFEDGDGNIILIK